MAKKKEPEQIIEEVMDPNYEALHLVVDRVNLFESYINPIKEKRKEWWRIFRGELSEPQYDYQTNVAIPYTTATVETILPRMLEAETHFRYRGETEKDDENAPNIEELANDQMRQDKLEMTKLGLYKECLILGTGIAKVVWEKEEHISKRKRPIFKMGKIQIGNIEQTIKKLRKDGPTVEHIPLDDFMFDFYGYRINGKNGCEWVAHRKIVTMTELLKNKNYDLSSIQSLKNSSSNGKPNLDDSAQNITEINKPKDKHKDAYELIEYWQDDRVITILNRSIVIRDESNPFWDGYKPFISVVDRPIPHTLLGMGEVEFMIGLQNLLNDMICQSFDIQKIALNKLVFIESGSGLNKSNFISQPFGIHTVNDLQKIKVVELPGVDPETTSLIEMLKVFMENISGVSDYSKGTNSTDMNDTAAGIKLIQDAANFVFKMKIKIANKMFLEDLGNFIVSRNQQFLNRSQTVLVNTAEGEQYKEISNKDIRGNFICEIEEHNPLNETQRQSEAIMLLRDFAQDPDVNTRELKKNVFEAFKLNPEKIMKQPNDAEEEVNITRAEDEAEKEDELMAAGKAVQVSPNDDHEVHIIVHEEEMAQVQDEVYPIYDTHVQDHKAFLSPRLGPMMEQNNVGGENEEGNQNIPEEKGETAPTGTEQGEGPTGSAPINL
jgi:hypothetical protein